VKTPEQQKARGGGCANLAEHAATWATPRAGKTSSEDPEVWAKRKASGDVSTMPLTLQSENWITPHGMTGVDRNGNTGAGGEFANQAVNWATPSACDDQGTHEGGQGRSLRTDVANWHTPRGMDGREKGAAGGTMESIGTQVQRWGTPTTNDSKNSLTGSQDGRGTLTAEVTNFRPDPETSEHGESSSPESHTSRRHSPPRKQLNWEFVRALMGFPEGWL
jgi:hypothetical protein